MSISGGLPTIYVGDMSAEKRINHPQDVLRVGQSIKAQVLEIDSEKRRVKLGIKQLVPTSIEEYIAERQAGNVVSGRVMEVSGEQARVELGEGINGMCRIAVENSAGNKTLAASKLDLASLTSTLKADWKGSAPSDSKAEAIRVGQIRSFRIAKLDPAAKKINLELI